MPNLIDSNNNNNDSPAPCMGLKRSAKIYYYYSLIIHMCAIWKMASILL